MSGRFVRASKFRHVYGQPVKREKYYDNIRLTKNGWDSNLIKVNPKYISVNWDASGGGAFAVVPLTEVGKLPELIPLFRGHTAPVLDTEWNPFDDDMVVSGSDDGTIGIYKVPEGFTTHVEDPEDIKDITPIKKLKGHSKKVGHVTFHPVAENVLASASGDFTVKIWDIESEQCLTTLVHTDLITSMAFNENGSLLATVTRDKQLRVWDIRENKIISEGKAHNGAKSQRLCWMGSLDRIVTTGFDRSDRQYAMWDAKNIENGPIGGFQLNGSSSGICMPFYDEGNHILYLVGRGDGNIQYLEYSEDQFFPLSEFSDSDPQRGAAVLPRRALSLHNHEIFRVYKTIHDTTIEPVSFFVPRKAETFQDDVYPDARANVAALTAEEFWSGKDSNPKMIALAEVFDGADAKPFTGTVSKKASVESIKKAEPAKPKKEQEPPKEEPKKQDPAPISEKKNLDEILSGSSVDKLLDKANNTQDAPPKSLDQNSWESDDDEPAAARAKQPRAAAIQKQTSKEPGSESEQEQVPTPTKREQKPLLSSSSTSSSSSPIATGAGEKKTAKTETDVGSLNDQISKLSSTLDFIVDQLKQRDDKIDKLEQKIDSLLNKD